jgi:hypothetical protein
MMGGSERETRNGRGRKPDVIQPRRPPAERKGENRGTSAGIVESEAPFDTPDRADERSNDPTRTAQQARSA